MRYFLLFILIFFLSSFQFANAEIDPMLNLDTPPDLSFQFPKFQKPEIHIPKPPTYSEYKIKKGTSNEVIPSPSSMQEKKGLFSGVKSFFNDRKNKKQRPKFDTPGAGYKGNLPNVEADFDYKKPKSSSPDIEGDNLDNYAPEDFENARTDDPLFLDAILNKGKPSQYVNDMFTVMRFLESFRKIIQNHEDIQKFNANVNLLDLYARKMEKTYGDKPEGMTPSYWFLQDLAYKAKVLGNLKFDANYYSKFSPIQGTKYDPDNLIKEDDKLLLDLDKTVFSIRQLGN